MGAHRQRRDPLEQRVLAAVEAQRPPPPAPPTIGQAAARASVERERAIKIDRLERMVRNSADQREINLAIVQLLREGS